MPTMNETLQSTRSAATVNAAALLSVRTQAAAALLEVETWPNSPSKGLVRDQLTRLLAAYDVARTHALRLVAGANNVLNAAGSLPPDPSPAAIAWSTAEF